MSRFYGNGNRIYVPALPGVDVEGSGALSVAAQNRVDRAVQEYSHPRFRGGESTILFSGGLEGSHLMGQYAARQYGISPSAILIEDESTTIEESFILSSEKFPDFFEPVRSGDWQLGVATQERYMRSMLMMGSQAPGLYGNWLRKLPTFQEGSETDETTVSRFAVLQPPEHPSIAAD